MIIGASGTGTSSLGHDLAKELKVPHYDGDDYYWVDTDPPYTIKRDLVKKQELLKSDVDNNEGWIFSGSPASWAPFIITMLTHVIFIYLPWKVRRERICIREQKRFGERIIPGGDMYENHQKFIEWAKGYDTNDTSSRTLSRHQELLKSIDVPMMHIKDDVSIENLLIKTEKFLEVSDG